MPFRRNNYYADPALAKSFDNLSSLFAAPTGADVYGYTHAAAEKAKAGRLADLYRLAQDPNTPQSTIDRIGVASGAYNPNQSYYSVDQNNATSIHNQDTTNTTTIKKTQMDNDASLARQYAQPVHVGQNETVYMPTQTAAATGLPGMFGGQISLSPGEKVIKPGGDVVQGNSKPLTDAETRGAILGKLPENEQRVAALGSVPTEIVKGADGQPTNVFRPDAVGKTPVMDDSKTPKPTVANYKLADQQGKPGLAGTAILDPVGGFWKDSQTGEKLPAGAVTYTAALQGDKAGTGLGPTTANTTSANTRAAEVTRALDVLDLYEGLIKNKPGVVGIPGLIRGTAQDAVATARDVANSFGKTVPQIQDATNELSKGLKGVAPEMFDPSIPEADFYKGTLAYALARTENPSGEVSRQAYDRAHQRIAGGVLSNPDSILAATGAFRKTLQTELNAIGTLRDPSTARTNIAPAGAAAPGATPAAPATPSVLKFDANGNPI